MSSGTVPALLLALLLSAPSAKADVSVALTNTSDPSQDLRTYSKIDFFKNRYANTPSSTVGFLHLPDNISNCSPGSIGQVPLDGLKWIAVMDNYPGDCIEEVIMNVKNAGYRLILAASANDSNFQLSKTVSNLNFPIVLIQDYYMRYLLRTALSDFEDPRPQIKAAVGTDMTTFITICLLTFGFALFTCCCVCCLCCCWCVSRRRRRHIREYEIRQLEQQRRNYRLAQNRDHMARQELIESILRQLQQLQLDAGQARPLGAERTQQLPTEKYRKLSDSTSPQEACAICVDDFRSGDNMRVLPCKHHFHQVCIDEWLINHSDLCPLCKKQVPRGEGGPDQVQVQGAMAGRRRVQGGGLARDLVLFTDEDESTESDFSVEGPLDRPQDRLVGGGPAAGGRFGRSYGSV